MIFVGHHVSGGFSQPAVLEVNLLPGPAAKWLARSCRVVEAEVAANCSHGIREGVVSPQVNLFVLAAPPQLLDGRPFRMLTVVDHLSCECPMIEDDFSMFR